MKNLIITLLVAFSFLFVTETKAQADVCEVAINQIAIILNGNIVKKEFDASVNRMFFTVHIDKYRDKENVFWRLKKFARDYSDVEVVLPWTYSPDHKKFYTGMFIGKNEKLMLIFFIEGTKRNALLFGYEPEEK